MKKILIIDGSSMQIRTLTGLMKNKFEIVTAMSGFDGMEILKNEKWIWYCWTMACLCLTYKKP